MANCRRIRVSTVRKVVADAGEHRGALFDHALHPSPHFVKSNGGVPDLARAAGREVQHLSALAEIVDRSGQRQDRLYLIAQEQDRHRQQDD